MRVITNVSNLNIEIKKDSCVEMEHNHELEISDESIREMIRKIVREELIRYPL